MLLLARPNAPAQPKPRIPRLPQRRVPQPRLLRSADYAASIFRPSMLSSISISQNCRDVPTSHWPFWTLWSSWSGNQPDQLGRSIQLSTASNRSWAPRYTRYQQHIEKSLYVYETPETIPRPSTQARSALQGQPQEQDRNFSNQNTRGGTRGPWSRSSFKSATT